MRSLLDIVKSWFTPGEDRLELHAERRRMMVHAEVSGGKH